MTVLDDADGNSETGSAGGPRSDEIPAPNHPSLRQHSMAHAQLVTPVQRKNINLKKLIKGQRNSMQCTEFGIIYPLLGHVQAGAKHRCDGYFSRLNWGIINTLRSLYGHNSCYHQPRLQQDTSPINRSQYETRTHSKDRARDRR